MSEKEYVNFLGKFDKKVWRRFQEKLSPYGTPLARVIEDLIKIFIGETEGVNENLLREVKKIMEEIEYE